MSSSESQSPISAPQEVKLGVIQEPDPPPPSPVHKSADFCVVTFATVPFAPYLRPVLKVGL